MSDDARVIDVDAASFAEEVTARSRDVPVVVDFWAAWCGPCRTLGPILEAAVADRAGDVVLAKVDVDAWPDLARRFGVRGIPAVVAFREGEVVDRFVGALPRTQVEEFLDRVVPSEADRHAAAGLRALAGDDPAPARDRFRRALEADPDHRVAAVELARMLADELPDRALELLAPHRPDPAAEQVAARAELARQGDADVDGLRAQVQRSPQAPGPRVQLGRALAARGDHEEAIEHLLAAIRPGDGDVADARELLLAVFRVLGDDHPLVPEARRRLTNALF